MIKRLACSLVCEISLSAQQCHVECSVPICVFVGDPALRADACEDTRTWGYRRLGPDSMSSPFYWLGWGISQAGAYAVRSRSVHGRCDWIAVGCYNQKDMMILCCQYLVKIQSKAKACYSQVTSIWITHHVWSFTFNRQQIFWRLHGQKSIATPTVPIHICFRCAGLRNTPL